MESDKTLSHLQMPLCRTLRFVILALAAMMRSFACYRLLGRKMQKIQRGKALEIAVKRDQPAAAADGKGGQVGVRP